MAAANWGTMSEDVQKAKIVTRLEDRMFEVSPCICYTYFHPSALAPHQQGPSQVHDETNTEYPECSVLKFGQFTPRYHQTAPCLP